MAAEPPLSDRSLADYIARHGIDARLVHPGAPTPTVADAARALGVDEASIVKSLVFIVEDEPLLVVAAGPARISPKLLAEALAVSRRRLRLASGDEALEITGFQIGAMPPFGHRRRLRTFADRDSLPPGRLAYAGGGSRDALLELSTTTLLQVTLAERVPLCRAEES